MDKGDTLESQFKLLELRMSGSNYYLLEQTNERPLSQALRTVAREKVRKLKNSRTRKTTLPRGNSPKEYVRRSFSVMELFRHCGSVFARFGRKADDIVSKVIPRWIGSPQEVF